MELRMNQSSYDEFEEVESPFASGNSEHSTSRDRLRARKNVFNRPFATESTAAPLVIESKSSRSKLRTQAEEIPEYRQSKLDDAEIEYLDEDDVELQEDEEVQLPKVRNQTKKKTKSSKNLLTKIGWLVVGALVLRLIFMDRGVWDYFATEGNLREKQTELKSIQNENRDLKIEISRLQLDKGYQKQLAKEQLGVIAADEFIILFAGEKYQEETKTDNSI